MNRDNYQSYYSEADVYRQKVLESYGYKFLRINKFNIGDNPITELNSRVSALIEHKKRNSDFIQNLHDTVQGLQDGNMKECPKCKEIKKIENFSDRNLLRSVGRICRKCKGLSESPKTIETSDNDQIQSSAKACPECRSALVLRNGRYGQFYGCSKYPYCKGTRKYPQ